jgi:hypothetical protein
MKGALRREVKRLLRRVTVGGLPRCKSSLRYKVTFTRAQRPGRPDVSYSDKSGAGRKDQGGGATAGSKPESAPVTDTNSPPCNKPSPVGTTIQPNTILQIITEAMTPTASAAMPASNA